MDISYVYQPHIRHFFYLVIMNILCISISHACLVHISCISLTYLLHITCKSKVYLMYMECISHCLCISNVYLMHISCISHAYLAYLRKYNNKNKGIIMGFDTIDMKGSR